MGKDKGDTIRFLAIPHNSFGLARCEDQKGCSAWRVLLAPSSKSDDQGGAASLRTSSPRSCYETKGALYPIFRFSLIATNLSSRRTIDKYSIKMNRY